MLTQKQRELLLYIHESMKDGDVSPSFDEMRDALGLKSKSGIHRLINALVDRGYLERLPHRARAIQIKRLPKGCEHPECKSSVVSFSDKNTTQRNKIPIYGKIAAGTPRETICDFGKNIEVPPSMINADDDFYALEVDGISMTNAGIHNGDIVIINKSKKTKSGDIAVALIDNRVMTLKRLRSKDKDTVTLSPDCDSYESTNYDVSRVKFEGTLVGLIRNYC